MFQPSPLRASLERSLADVFGAPNSTFGRNPHWSLLTDGRLEPLNILLNGTPTRPVVWVFDPHDSARRVARHEIADEAEIGPLIEQIKHRSAGESSDPSGLADGRL